MSFSPLIGSWGLVLAAIYLVIALYAAVAVYLDANSRKDLFLGLHPLWWAAITLTGSLVAVVAYWVMHYSNLRPSGSSSLSGD